MENSSEARRKINSELKSRSHNQRAKRMLEDHVPADIRDELRIDFYCECSDDSCTAKVPLTFEEYDRLHDSPAKFVLAPGHQSPAIEKVTRRNDDHFVVEKFAL